MKFLLLLFLYLPTQAQMNPWHFDFQEYRSFFSDQNCGKNQVHFMACSFAINLSIGAYFQQENWQILPPSKYWKNPALSINTPEQDKFHIADINTFLPHMPPPLPDVDPVKNAEQQLTYYRQLQSIWYSAFAEDPQVGLKVLQEVLDRIESVYEKLLLPNRFSIYINSINFFYLHSREKGVAIQPKSINDLNFSFFNSMLLMSPATPAVNKPSLYHEKYFYYPLHRFSKADQIEDFRENWDLFKEKTEVLILDLRGNAGPSQIVLDAFLKLFFESNQILYWVFDLETQKIKKTFVGSSNPLVPKEIPIILLANSSTSLEGEVFLGAFRENERAFIVGERSDGDASKIKRKQWDFHPHFYIYDTDSFYLLPRTASSFHLVGIQPDFEISDAYPYESFSMREEDNWYTLESPRAFFELPLSQNHSDYKQELRNCMNFHNRTEKKANEPFVINSEGIVPIFSGPLEEAISLSDCIRDLRTPH